MVYYIHGIGYIMWTIVMDYAIIRGQIILAKWNLLEIWDILCI
jgi:hypothetical protein